MRGPAHWTVGGSAGCMPAQRLLTLGSTTHLRLNPSVPLRLWPKMRSSASTTPRPAGSFGFPMACPGRGSRRSGASIRPIHTSVAASISTQTINKNCLHCGQQRVQQRVRQSVHYSVQRVSQSWKSKLLACCRGMRDYSQQNNFSISKGLV